MTSSLANAIKRRTHKERSQPANRRKFGLLEKHKDYVERARNFHKKEKTIKALQKKAEERNPDEFYFGMEKARTKEGVHQGSLSKSNKYSQEELRLMKTQDVKYLTLKARTDEEKAKRLQQSLHFIGAPGARQGAQHTVFVDSVEEARGWDAAAHFDTPAELLDRTFNRPRTAQLASQQLVQGADNKKLERQKAHAYRELSQRLQRSAKLASTAADLAYRKEVMGKGRKRKLRTPPQAEGEGGAVASQRKVFVWKRERRK